MKKILLFLSLILLSGCSFTNPFLKEKINKVTLVTHNPYMKHHIAFLARDGLKIIKNNKKYIYLYNARKHELAVLLHKKNTFFLYAISTAEQNVHSLFITYRTKYTYALKHFKTKGYYPIASPASKGFLVKVSPRILNRVRTFLFDVKEYTRLLALYKKSIRSYDASRIKYIKTTLPSSLVYAYYKYYENKTKNKKAYKQLNIIANKLHIKGPYLAKHPIRASKISTTDAPKKEEQSTKQKTEQTSKDIAIDSQNTSLKNDIPWYDFSKKEPLEVVKKEEKQSIQKKPKVMPYRYYLNTATLNELQTFLAKPENKKSLTHSKYLALKQRKDTLKEQKILKEGNLEELIAAYKHNKNPKFKARILSLMKEKLK